MDNLKHQLTEMVERDRNRPAIIIWGLADDLNEYQFSPDLRNCPNTPTRSTQPVDRRPGPANVTDIIYATRNLQGPVGGTCETPGKNVHLERMGGNGLRTRPRRTGLYQ